MVTLAQSPVPQVISAPKVPSLPHNSLALSPLCNQPLVSPCIRLAVLAPLVCCVLKAQKRLSIAHPVRTVELLLGLLETALVDSMLQQVSVLIAQRVTSAQQAHPTQ